MTDNYEKQRHTIEEDMERFGLTGHLDETAPGWAERITRIMLRRKPRAQKDIEFAERKARKKK